MIEAPISLHLQVIGCVGALRLNERLLNAYWLILLGLLVGDVVVGGYWYNISTLTHINTSRGDTFTSALRGVA